MNIFYLSRNFQEAAEMHLDKHVVKMIIEYAQLMSTAHRYLDGKMYYDKTKNGRAIKRWLHPNEEFENTLYKASHINHPSNKWVRESKENYMWLYKLWIALCEEYTYRYGKVHLTFKKLHKVLNYIPDNIPDIPLTEMAQAMPDDCKDDCSVKAYRKYYNQYKHTFAIWTKRDIPEWYQENKIIY